jgi:hypothetical protein
MFCGPTMSPLTLEHFPPKWVTKALLAGKTNRVPFRAKEVRSVERYPRLFYPGETLPPPELETRFWRQHLMAQASRSVCKDCNNEWLSDFENNYSRPLLLPMLDGHTVALSIEDQIVLAAWVFKGAVVSEDTNDRHPKFFTARTRRRVRDSLEPQGHTWVWLAEYRGPHKSLQMMPTTTLGEFSFTATINRFAFQIFSSKYVKSLRIPDRWSHATIRIWPNPEDRVDWPPSQYVDPDSFQAFGDRWAPVSLSQPQPIVRHPSE